MLVKRLMPMCLFALWVVTVVAGCGADSSVKPIANLVPCSGTITFDGKPLEQGTVFFTPEDPATGRAASGTVKAGEFKMVTTVSAPGVVVGKYKIAVQALDAPKFDEKHPPMGPVPSLIPAKYTSIKSSGLSTEVSKGMQPVKIELKKE